MEHEVKEYLTVDSVMTADGEVVPLPTLGPLGPVDAEGGRIPLDTVTATAYIEDIKYCPFCGEEL